MTSYRWCSGFTRIDLLCSGPCQWHQKNQCFGENNVCTFVLYFLNLKLATVGGGQCNEAILGSILGCSFYIFLLYGSPNAQVSVFVSQSKLVDICVNCVARGRLCWSPSCVQRAEALLVLPQQFAKPLFPACNPTQQFLKLFRHISW